MASRPRVPLGPWAVIAVLATASPARAEVHVTKGPYVTDVYATGADIRFEFDQKSAANLTVVPDGVVNAPLHMFESRDVADMHVVRATGLEPGTKYGYAVRLGSALLGEGYITTAPPNSSLAPVTFLVYGDDRTDPTAHAAIVRAMTQVPSAFLVNTGDMVEDGGDAEAWQTFFSVEAPLLHDRPLFVAIGNHELFNDSAGVNFARYFGFPDTSGQLHLYGTVRFGMLRLFFLNAMHDWDSGEERDWLERSLKNADREDVLWRVAVAHHGPWSSGPHGPNTRLLDAHIPELLAAHKVDLFLSGHDHIYERGDAGPIKYIVSGGGGAPLYRVERAEGVARKAESTYHFLEVTVTPAALRVVARRVDGTLLDRCGFGRGQPWDCDAPGAQAVGGPGPAAPGGPRSSSSNRCSCSLFGVGPSGRPVVLALAFVIALGGLRRGARPGGASPNRARAGAGPKLR
jgi:hypothetical protein